MAKILGKDPSTYSRERDGFLRDLQHFHETRGTPYRRPPKISGHEIDLYLLYSLVTAQGGWIKVNSRNGWPELFEQFGLPTKCVNGSVALKQIYLRYLDRWEKVHFLGEEADRGSDDDEESRHRRWSARALHSVPCVYNYQQHNIADSIRDYNHLSTELYKASDYDRLVLSLISPLPNEQDFAINVCTLLSNDGKHTLKLEKKPRLLDYLLAHAGVFNHSSLRKLFVHCYSNIRKHSLHSFWRDVIDDDDPTEILDLTDETNFVQKSEVIVDEETSFQNSLLKDETVSAIPTFDVPMDVSGDDRLLDKSEQNHSDSNSDCEIVSEDGVIDDVSKGRGFKLNLNLAATDRELFCLGRTLGTQDYIGQRVLQIATILRNLSFIEDNLTFLVKNQTFIRFLLLCASSRWAHLKNLGLDMLGNVATEFLVKDSNGDKLADVLLKVVTKCLHSEDRSSCISSLEVLNKLSQNEANEESLLRLLQSDVYKKVCSFLTLHDVMLLIYTLECLYSLSSLGERACNLIVNNHGVVDTLVSLVTVEGKSYGPKACIGMKLVETIPGGSNVHSSQSGAASTTTTTSSTTTSSASPTATASSTTTVSTSSTVTQVTASVIKPLQSTPSRPVAIASQRLIAITPVSSGTTTSTVQTTQVTQVITSQQLVQQQHAHQQAIQENEQFALTWLRATYEPCASGRVDHQELYKHYINSCAKIGRRGVIAPLHFPRCVRSVFGGTVGPNPVKPANSTDPQYYEGIKVRAQPLVINTQSSITPTPQSPAKTVRRKGQSLTQASTPPPPNITVVADNPETPPASPASPILKAQLSAPPKQREVTVTVAATANKGDAKSQVMAHPHLSQALLGNNNNNTSATSKDTQASQSNTSLIKSLLATKVNNDCMTTVSMKTATDCQNVTQVAARQQQQRLLAQQNVQTPDNKASAVKATETPKTSRLNGARQLFSESDGDSAVSSTTTNSVKNIRDPPQPPPPLAPLSNTNRTKVTRIDNEDSDSTGNNSLASSSGLGTIGIGGISSTEDNDNSLTSFEGLLNGVPNIDNPLNEDSNSKDSLKNSGSSILSKNKPLMLADLLEKKVDKDPPMLMNGVLGKELRIGDKGLELVENHIEKALKKEPPDNSETIHIKTEIKTEDDVDADIKSSLKRPATDDIVESEAKKMHLSSNNVNGSVSSPAPESVSSSNGDEGTGTVSTAAAKLFADIAADILEDEEEELMQQESQIAAQQPEIQQPSIPQIIVDSNQQVLLTQPRQIIVSQPQMSVLPAQIKTTQSGQTVIVQNATQQRAPVLLQQANTGQILLSQGLQGQVQLVASTTQPGQYVIQTGGTQSAYVVAQPQTAVVHGQPQTVLVAQTAQQQGTTAKTIIILQQQPATNTATHHQKVVVTPQGQQVVVTQVQRPILQASTVSNNVVPTSTVSKTTATTVITQTSVSNTVSTVEKKEEVKPPPPPPKPKVVRDLTSPFVCEWGDCQIEAPFKSANEVYLHACESHCPQGSEEIVCLWDRCDNLKRKRFSLMTHLHDKHCNTEAMKASLARRKQLSQSGKVEVSTPAPVTPHPGYAPDAAFHAIKRHALEFVNPKELQRPTKQGSAAITAPAARSGPAATEQDDNEGPVTKSIRLTASLILRNLVIYSSNCRRYLKHYEPHLANVALSNVESSRTIAQVLYDMNEGTNHR